MGNRTHLRVVEEAMKGLSKQLSNMAKKNRAMSVRVVEKKYVVSYHANFKAKKGFCIVYKIANNGWCQIMTSSGPVDIIEEKENDEETGSVTKSDEQEIAGSNVQPSNETDGQGVPKHVSRNTDDGTDA